MAFMNMPPGPYGRFPPPSPPPPNQHMGNHQIRPPGNARFPNGCPWRMPPPERPNFNVNNFMMPPHMLQRPPPAFPPDNPFDPSVSGPVNEQFPFPNPHSQNHHPHNFPGPPGHGNFQNSQNGPPNRGHPGRGRGNFMRGPHGAHGFRGGFRGGYNQQHNQQQGYQPGNNKNKKPKINKREFPENNAYFCDICDRGFKTEDKYKEHVDGHIKCSYKDCPFIAAPKLVQLHMSMQHRSGLAKKVWSLESEADINKWREDRKRNYPTPDNVAKKKQEREDKIARGEVLETKQFGKMNRGRGRGRDRNFRQRGRHRGGRRGRWRNYGQDENDTVGVGSDSDGPPEEIAIQKSPVVIVSSPEHEGNKTLLDTSVSSQAAASLSLLASYGDSTSDELSEDDFTSDHTVEKKGAVESSGSAVLSTPLKPGDNCADPLGLILKSSQSPSSSSSSPSSSPIPPFSSPPPPSSSLPPLSSEGQVPVDPESTGNSTDVCTEEPATLNSPEELLQPSHRNRKSKRCRQGTGQTHNNTQHTGNCKDKPANAGQADEDTGEWPLAKKKKQETQNTRKYTLLEKLLSPDIRRERNKILQCVHFIVKHNFFLQDNLSVAPGLPDPEVVEPIQLPVPVASTPLGLVNLEVGNT